MPDKSNANKPAYPASSSWKDEKPEIIQVEQEGMSKREVFTAMAMQSFIINKNVSILDAVMNKDDILYEIARASVLCADETLKQLG